MTNNDKVRELVVNLRCMPWTDEQDKDDCEQAARLIEKLTGEPSEGMIETGADAAYTNPHDVGDIISGYKAMTEQGIKEVLDDG